MKKSYKIMLYVAAIILVIISYKTGRNTIILAIVAGLKIILRNDSIKNRNENRNKDKDKGKLKDLT